MQTLRIKSVKKLGVQKSVDFEVDHPDHNFYAEGMITSNSHSVAYAALAAQTVFLKFKYPKQFFLALLRMTKHESEPIGDISKIQKELHDFGIRLLPPHILKSDLDFTVEGDNIRFGLLSIKGISDKSIEKLKGFKSVYSNKFQIFQAATECKIGIGILSALIQAGALEPDKPTQSRSRVVLEAQTWNILTDNEKKLCLSYGKEFDYNLIEILKLLKVKTNEKEKPLIKASRYETIKKRYKPFLAIYEQNKKNEKFANWYYERSLLGYTYHSTLKEIFTEFTPNLMSIREAADINIDSHVMFVGVIKETYSGVSKKKTKYYRAMVTDETDGLNCLLFDTVRHKNVEHCKNINGGLPKEENIVIVHGKKKDDCIFAETITIQDQKVYTKLRDLKSKDIEEESESELTTNSNKE